MISPGIVYIFAHLGVALVDRYDIAEQIFAVIVFGAVYLQTDDAGMVVEVYDLRRGIHALFRQQPCTVVAVRDEYHAVVAVFDPAHAVMVVLEVVISVHRHPAAVEGSRSSLIAGRGAVCVVGAGLAVVRGEAVAAVHIVCRLQSGAKRTRGVGVFLARSDIAAEVVCIGEALAEALVVFPGQAAEEVIGVLGGVRLHDVAVLVVSIRLGAALPAVAVRDGGHIERGLGIDSAAGVGVRLRSAGGAIDGA